jgi:hypothetical protein
MSGRYPNFRYSNDQRNLTVSGRQTIPIGVVAQTPIQKRGSIIFDSLSLKLYYSDGTQWVLISSGESESVCIQDVDGDTSVCTDTIPGTDSDTIFFNTAGSEKARISPDGVFMVGTTTPTADKIAHFEGDIKVTGVIDPTAVQFEEVSDHPVDPTGTTTGVIWVKDDNPNILIFTDNDGVDTQLTSGGGVTDLQGTLTVGNFTGGNDIILTTGDEIVGQTNVVISGADTTGGTGGNVDIKAGDDSAAGDGGSINITSGDSVTGTLGDVNISSAGNINISSAGNINFTGDLNIVTTFVVQTTDNTPTLLDTILLDEPNTIYSIQSTVMSRSGVVGATFTYNSAFHRDGGTTVRQIGSSFRSEHKDNPTWKVNFVMGVSVVEVYVIGDFSTIDWKISRTLYKSD